VHLLCLQILQEVLVASLLCRFKPEIESYKSSRKFWWLRCCVGASHKLQLLNPAGRFGGVAVVLVQARNCKLVL